MSWEHAFYTALIWGGWIGSVAFPIIYAVTARFWNNQLGRHFWAYSTVIAMLYTSSIVKNYIPSFSYDTPLRYVLLTMSFIVIWWRIYEYFRIMKAERKTRLDKIEALERHLKAVKDSDVDNSHRSV